MKRSTRLTLIGALVGLAIGLLVVGVLAAFGVEMHSDLTLGVPAIGVLFVGGYVWSMTSDHVK